jgi:hypothetical protein
MIVQVWTFMFWVPLLASTTSGCLLLGRGMVMRPLPVLVWFAAALLLQSLSGQFSAAWTVGLVAQSALAIYLTIRLKFEG